MNMSMSEQTTDISGPTIAEQASEQLIKGLYERIHQSVRRRTPFLSKDAAGDLADDVCENVSAFLREAFSL